MSAASPRSDALVMKKIALFLLCAACASPRPHREVRPDALKGVSILMPAPIDERPSPGVGCGFVAQDLALRANKALVQAFSDAGATLVARGTADYGLNVTLRDAVMGAENEGRRRTDRPISNPQPDAPPLEEPQASLFNSGNDRTQVVLEATLSKAGRVIWAGSVTGSARSAPCMQTMEKVREALQDAVETLRSNTIRALSR